MKKLERKADDLNSSSLKRDSFKKWKNLYLARHFVRQKVHFNKKRKVFNQWQRKKLRQSRRCTQNEELASGHYNFGLQKRCFKKYRQRFDSIMQIERQTVRAYHLFIMAKMLSTWRWT